VAHRSAPGDLALHGVRVLGFPAASRIAGRYGLDPGTVQELLLDHEARGWVRQLSFAGSSGWSLTEAGRAENERRLAAELERACARHIVAGAHRAFLPLNRQFGVVCTDWQIRPAPGEPMTFNDHTDQRWDGRILQALGSLQASFGRLCGQLSESLTRFDGYAGLYSSALGQVEIGHQAWVDAPGQDSLHVVWIQFHEDLLATLGIERGMEA
jgi:hypothetical protein